MEAKRVSMDDVPTKVVKGSNDRKKSMMIASDIKKATATTDQDENMENLFSLVDSDNSGSISREEFATLYRKISEQVKADAQKEEMHLKKEAKQKAKIKNISVIVAGLVFFIMALAAVNTGLTAVIVSSFKDSFAKDDAAGSAVLSSSTGSVLHAGEAKESVPMLVAPVMPLSSLEAVKSISVTYVNPKLNTIVAEVMTIASVASFNATALEFLSPIAGRGVRVWNGVASVFTAEFTAHICAADVTCSSFSVSKSLAEGLEAQARHELEVAGFPVPDNLATPVQASVSAVTRRSLANHRLSWNCW